ncbi:MAG: cytidine deaminase [Anaerovoracaceae bacterium]|jgi:cytidine deaminase
MYRELYRRARQALANAYAPYSGFKVGAAIRTGSGRIYTGVNVENASYGAAICAERTAACKAVSEGDREFEAIAIASSDGAAWPCGICRQFLSEFSTDMQVITGDNEDHLEVLELSELLPKGFKI